MSDYVSGGRGGPPYSFPDFDPLLLEMIRDSNKRFDKVYEILFLGIDGKEPLVTRVGVIEHVATKLEKRVAKLEADNLYFKAEDRKAMWRTVVILSVMIVAWITAILTGDHEFIKWLFTLAL